MKFRDIENIRTRKSQPETVILFGALERKGQGNRGRFPSRLGGWVPKRQCDLGA